MQKTYLSTHRHFPNKSPGGPHILDESAGSQLHTPPQEINDADMFASVNATHGFLQYLPLEPGKPQGIRAIMVPDTSDCELEMLEMP
jgi:hypothetical protein